MYVVVDSPLNLFKFHAGAVKTTTAIWGFDSNEFFIHHTHTKKNFSDMNILQNLLRDGTRKYSLCSTKKYLPTTGLTYIIYSKHDNR